MQLPGPQHRTCIIGGTGSGKSTFACWLLSQMNWDKQPWIIVDYKYDELIGDIEGIHEISITDRKLPKHPGLYVVHPSPSEDEKVEDFLWRIWHKERTGLFLDEGYLIPDKEAYRTLLVTGRSKLIPIITNTQQPVRLPRHVFSESNFFVVFHLTDYRDQKTVENFLPIKVEDLPEFYSYYYDRSSREVLLLKPVPEADQILELYRDRMRPDRSFIWR